MKINKEKIEQDIATLESAGLIGEYNERGYYVAPHPNLHGLLVCLKDNRKYDLKEIESVCRGVCPHYDCTNKIQCHEHDDCKKYVFEGTSLDGETKYMEWENETKN